MIIDNQSNVTYDSVLPDGTTQNGEQTSNLVKTELMTDAVQAVKSSSAASLSEGQTATQTITITNNSSATLQNPTLTDTMGTGASYVSGSVTVNGTSRPSDSPAAGIALPDLPTGQSATVTYTIQADANITQPQVVNSAQLAYTVTEPSGGTQNFTQNTNDVTISLISTSLGVVKSVDKAYAASGDTLTYTITVTNTGTVPANSVTFRDPIPNGTRFVAGSVTVNGTSQPNDSPETGFALPDLAAGQSATVVFRVTVN